MTEEFKQTVNLREKMEQEAKAKKNERLVHEQAKQEKEKISLQAKKKKRAAEIDRVFNGDKDNKSTKKELSQITRPVVVSSQETLYKRVVITLGILVVILGAMWIFMKPKDVPDNSEALNEPVWYMVELVTGEEYYGQVEDIQADPIVIKNVYYNYDQLNKEAGEEPSPDTGNLRLVKRGKETHGPTGEMSLIRSQVKYLEPLSRDSKVLRAILEYEK